MATTLRELLRELKKLDREHPELRDKQVIFYDGWNTATISGKISHGQHVVIEGGPE
ncbi:hypothetical protein ACFVAJ_16940 [Agromyces sp. NPDC057679]|uniref:hypothetical protein n=1 Tax=Agromyces sp. NPDC057679 TaxID=3346207 RepID=UPI00366CD5CC